MIFVMILCIYKFEITLLYRSFKQSIIKTQLMENRIRQLKHRDMLMSTIIDVVHNNTSPKVRNKMLQKNNLNLSISMINLKTAQKDENE